MDPQIQALGEGLLAVVGLDEVLGDEPVKVTQAMRAEAAQIPKRFRAELRRFITTDGPFDRFKAAPKVSYTKAVDKLLAPPDDAARIAQLERMDSGDDQLALNLAVERALAWLRPMVPLRSRQTVTGPKQERPPEFALAHLRRALAIVEDPIRVPESMNMGTLLKEEVATLANVYPTLYASAVADIPALLTAAVVDKPRFELPWRRDRLLRRFLGQETMDPALAARLRAPFAKGAPSGQPSPKQGPPAPDVAKAVAPPTDRIAAK